MTVAEVTKQIKGELTDEVILDYLKRHSRRFIVTYVSNRESYRLVVTALNFEAALRQARIASNGAPVTVVDLGREA